MSLPGNATDSLSTTVEGFTLWVQSEDDPYVGILIENPSSIIRNNTILDPSGQGDGGACIVCLNGAVVEGNLIATGSLWGIVNDRGEISVRYNTFGEGCEDVGVPINTLEIGVETTFVEIRNNTFGVGRQWFRIFADGCEIDCVNNIFCEDTFSCSGSSDFTLNYRYNLSCPVTISGLCADNFVFGPGNLWGVNPLWCDWENCDYTLDAASPAIGAGENGETIGAHGVGCGIVGVPGSGRRADKFVVGAVRPNPSKGTVSFPVSVAGPQVLAVAVYDVAGRLVADLTPARLLAGTHELRWTGRASDGRPVSAGTYFLEVMRAGQREVRKLQLLR
jgi:hypothetical protein